MSSSRRSPCPSTLHSVGADEDTGSKHFELQISDAETLYIASSDGSKIPLLRGLSASTWSAGTGTCAGLFLHSSNPHGESSAFDTSLGKLESCNRLLACARLTRYWMGPAFGTSAKDIPLDTQFLLLEVEEGVYTILLPLLDGDFRASLFGNKANEIICHQESGDDNVKTSGTRALYIGVGDDPYALIKESFSAVAAEMKTFATLDEKSIPAHVEDFGWCTWDAFYSEVTPQGVIEGVKSLREAGTPPKSVILDDGWQQVEPTKKSAGKEIANNDAPKDQDKISIATRVANGLLSIFAKVVSVLYERFVRKAPHNSFPNKVWRRLTSTFLKDQMKGYFDNETDFARQLSGFEPNEKFQKRTGNDTSMELKELVTKLKTELDVTRLFCWHALHGYWRGVSPDLGSKSGFNATNIMPRLSDHLLKVEPVLAWDSVSLFGVGLVANEKDLATFYHNLHSPLVDAGVDGVKVDVQSGLASLGGGNGGGSHIARLYTEALENSVSMNFMPEGGPNCINCMCHSTENLYRYKTTSVARASDDFYPTRSDSHTVHLVNVAFNSLFIGEICLPDWDMFTTTCEAAEFHAAARSVSGGPVYVSDKPGEHNASLLKRLVFKDGSILRCLRPGRPTRDTLFCDVGRDRSSVLKVWNENPCGSGVVGLFNSQGVAWNFRTHENEVVNRSPPKLTASTKAHDVESLRGISGPFVAFRHRKNRLEYLKDGSTTIEATLDPKQWEIVTFVSVRQADSDGAGGISWAPIGLADMLNSGGSILDSTKLNADSDGGKRASTIITTRGPGRFIAYCRPEPSQISLVDDPTAPTSLPYTYDSRTGSLSFVLPSERMGKPHRVKVAWENQ